MLEPANDVEYHTLTALVRRRARSLGIGVVALFVFLRTPQSHIRFALDGCDPTIKAVQGRRGSNRGSGAGA
jgi:hypothetical protein